MLAGADAFAAAFTIPAGTISLSDPTDTFTYTMEAGEPGNPFGAVGQTSGWWKFQPAFAGTVTIDTYETHYPLNQCCGPAFAGFGDTTLEAFTGSAIDGC